MKIGKVFLGIYANDFAGQSEWWAGFLDRRWDRKPMPGCHEWDVTDTVLLQVLDGNSGGKTTVTLHVSDLDSEISRLRALDLAIPDPVKIDGFDTLRYCRFSDPEGNEVGMLDGE